MYDQKPTTSLVEDLQALGLLAEGEKLAKGRKLNENAGPMAPDAPPPAAHAEPDGDEAPVDGAAPPAPAPKAPPMPSKLASTAPPPKSDDMMGGMDGYDATGAAAPRADDLSDDDEVSAYEDAWECVKQYYALNEKNEKLSEDDYKTVVNAMAFIIETQGKYMGPDQLSKDPEELPGGTADWKGDAKNSPTDKVPGPLAMKKVKGYKWGSATPRPGEKAESVDALVGELKALTQKTESDDEMQELGNKVVEGFESIRDTAQEIAESIAKELKESREKVTESNPRLKLGKFFEGVSGDAKLLLKAISEREQTDVDDAIEDLNSLARDLKRGLAQL
jgi:hypothetical protein